VATGVSYRILEGAQLQSDALGQVSMRYHASVPAAKVPCFVRFPSIGQPPDQKVQPDSPVIVRFSEPMDPTTLKPFDTMVLLRKDPDTTSVLGAYDYVVGQVTASPDLREYTFSPVLPLQHDPASATPAEKYFLQVTGGTSGPTDLAGNALSDTMSRVQ